MPASPPPPPEGPRLTGRSGTLASPAVERPVVDPAPQVHVLPPQDTDGVLPIYGVRPARGVAPWLVVALVVGALAAGFALGWAAHAQ